MKIMTNQCTKECWSWNQNSSEFNNAKTISRKRGRVETQHPATWVSLKWRTYIFNYGFIYSFNFIFFFFRQTPTIPRDLDSRTTITIESQNFEIAADDLEVQCVLGRGAYGVVEKVKHKPTGTVLAVKVSWVIHRFIH